MKNIVGVRFKKLGKIYFFDSANLKLKKGDKVVVETSQGDDIAEVYIANREVDIKKLEKPLKKLLRIATDKDLKVYDDCKKVEKEAFKVCKEKIKQYKLQMELVEVEYRFDKSKLLFYFTADERIDFRDLVKDLASIYKTRIELRQIGVRDEVKRIGGNGVCGRELCCCTFLNDFDAVSMKMAKEQNISLNPSKISGNCGRLMCCLKYESEVYEEKLKRLPSLGALVRTPDGDGEIDNIEILKEIVRVKIKKDDTYVYKKYNAKDIMVLKDEAKEKNNAKENNEDEGIGGE